MNEQTLKNAITQGAPFNTYQSESQIEQVIRWKVCDAGKLRGQQLDDSTLQTICRKIAEVILRDYPTLTDKELDIVLEAGVSGEFGKETWVSGAIILQWLRQYNRHASRIAIVDEQEETKKTRKRMSKEEIDELNDTACREKAHSAFEYFKEHGTIFADADARGFHLPQYAAIVYGWIKEHSNVPQPNAEQVKAAEQYAANMIAQRNTRKEYIPAAYADWRDSYLLQEYYKNFIN